MGNKSEIYGGFDLTFIDINVLPIDSENSSLIRDFPPIGSHHTNSEIEFRPGGNGFNLCRTLASLGNKTTYVGPSSSHFEQLVEDLEIPLDIYPIDDVDVGFTAILNLEEGEIQFNSVKGNLAPGNLNPELLEIYNKSPLKSISNISLNSTSIEWVSSLLLSLIDPQILEKGKKDYTFTELVSMFQETSFDGILFVDPCDISHFPRLSEFGQILKQLKKFNGEKFLSVNEFEIEALQGIFNKSPKEMSEFLDIPIIFHTADSVRYYGKENFKLPAKTLIQKRTFVGAGDCFNGGFLHSLFNSSSIMDALEFAIDSASHLIETGNYPTVELIQE